MKKTLLMTCALLALTAGLALAGPGGVSLGWVDCQSGGGLDNRNFACNTNTGVHTMVGSFHASSFMTGVQGFSAVVDVQTQGPSLADWWSVRASLPAGCRPASMTANFDFTGGPAGCFDYWQGGATGGITADAPVDNRIRMKPQAALPLNSPNVGPVSEGTEVSCFKININSARTVGLGACAGCPTPACIVLNQIHVTQNIGNPNGSKTLTNPILNTITWQGGDVQACQGATPARNSTWGQVKSLYR